MKIRPAELALVSLVLLACQPALAGWFDNFNQYSAGVALNAANSDWDVFRNQSGAGIQPIEYPALNAPNPIQGLNPARAAMFRAVGTDDDSLYFNVRFGHPTNPAGSSLHIAMTQNAAVDPTYNDLTGVTAFVGLTIDTRIGDVLINTLQFNAVAANGTGVSSWDLNFEAPKFQVDVWYDGRVILNDNNTADFAYKLDSSNTWIENNGLPVPAGFDFKYVAIVTHHQLSAPIWVDNVGTREPLIGDLNADGFVGQNDLNIILGHWGQNVADGNWLMGDPSGDGFVGQSDLNDVLSGWGQGDNSLAISPVPEPHSLMLIVTAMMSLVLHSSVRRMRICQVILSWCPVFAVGAALLAASPARADFIEDFESYSPGGTLDDPWVPGSHFGVLGDIHGTAGFNGTQGFHSNGPDWNDGDRASNYNLNQSVQVLSWKAQLSSANGIGRLLAGVGNSTAGTLFFEMDGNGNKITWSGAGTGVGFVPVVRNTWYQMEVTLTNDGSNHWSWMGQYAPYSGNVLGSYSAMGSGTLGAGFAPQTVSLQSIYAFTEANGTSTLDDVQFVGMGPVGPEPALDRGHRILIERGLQIQAGYNETTTGELDTHEAVFAQSKFTGRFLLTGGVIPVNDSAWGGQWGGVYPNFVYGTDYAESNLVALQAGDEQSLADPTELFYAKNFLRHWRERFPNALGYTNQASLGNSVPVLRNYMTVAQPDMLVFDHYGFVGNVGIPGETDPVLGGSPTKMYELMQVYRQLALAGNDGTGATPIPYGRYLQLNRSFTGHLISDSEARLDQFSGWAFGYTFSIGYLYDPGTPPRESVLLDQQWNPKPLFYQVAETNRQSLNLGPALVRLVSTDFRFIPGQHKSGASTVFNAIPDGIPVWSDSADPYITGISAQNLGTKNDGLKGDVLVGYFTPLRESFDGDAYENEIYFMIVNGLSDLNGTVAETRQLIRINFDFGNTGIDSLQRLSRDTGLVETVPLVANGSGLFYLDLILDGGTGDLFKFNTGAPFVGIESPAANHIIPEPSTAMLMSTLVAILLIHRWIVYYLAISRSARAKPAP